MIIASIDIGTNTILLLIAKTDNKSNNIIPLLNEYRMPRLGKGLKPGKNIQNDRLINLFEILSEYQQIIIAHNTEKVIITATNAFRIAANANEILIKINNKFGYDVDIITGETEAKYAYLGAILSSMKNVSSLVIDIGGGSTEIISGKNNRISYRKSFQVGSISATEYYLIHSPSTPDDLINLDNYLVETFQELKDKFTPELAIAIAGTPTTLFCMVNDVKNYDDSIVEGSRLTYSDIKQLLKILQYLSPSEIKERYGKVMQGREDIILGGSVILLNIMKLLELSEVIVSARGIRYGAIIHYLTSRH
ncbi:MAG: hypothetical protein O6940_13255 [Ignavibacteria bacterium]|nr:hypothetical protein [Ignavibacteria bacterium]